MEQPPNIPDISEKNQAMGELLKIAGDENESSLDRVNAAFVILSQNIEANRLKEDLKLRKKEFKLKKKEQRKKEKKDA